MTRAAIYQALFAKLPAATTKSRTLRLWAKVAPEEMPALFLAVASQQCDPLVGGVRRKWTTTAYVYVYVATPDPETTPAMDVLAAQLDAIEAALAPGPAETKQTLGGLVESVRITAVETDEGTLGSAAVGIVTLQIVASP